MILHFVKVGYYPLLSLGALAFKFMHSLTVVVCCLWLSTVIYYIGY